MLLIFLSIKLLTQVNQKDSRVSEDKLALRISFPIKTEGIKSLIKYTTNSYFCQIYNYKKSTQNLSALIGLNNY
jgi:hypothetical protein